MEGAGCSHYDRLLIRVHNLRELFKAFVWLLRLLLMKRLHYCPPLDFLSAHIESIHKSLDETLLSLSSYFNGMTTRVYPR